MKAHFDLKYEIYTGLEIICVLHLKGLIFQDTGKILKKKKKTNIATCTSPVFSLANIASCTSPIFIRGIIRASSELPFLNVVAQSLCYA